MTGVRNVSRAAADPVHEDAEGWWFRDETWADRLGPCPSEAAARERLKDYARQL